MASLVQVSAQFAQDFATVRTPAARRDVIRAIQRLEESDELPLTGDRSGFLPRPPNEPQQPIHVLAHVHRVKGRNLWLWYCEKRGGRVELLILSRHPPGAL